MQLYVVGYKDMDFFLKYQEFLHFFAKRDFVTGYCAKITWLIMGSRNHRDILMITSHTPSTTAGSMFN